MSLIFRKSGILTTVQDSGRNGFRRFGINPNGAMDKTAARLINILLGNAENEAVLEIHFPAPIIKFEENAVIALGGADFGAKIDEKQVENWRPIFVKKDQILRFSTKISGNRTYLSVKDGFEIKDWLKSKSTNLTAKIGGFEGRNLIKGDRILFRENDEQPQTNFDFFISDKMIPAYETAPTIRMIVGAEFDFLTALSEQILLKEEFSISNDSNRMGFRLSGKPLYLLDKIELVSSAVDFGTIQLLPGGQLIILMADHQTTGGYPRIGHIISADLPILAQLSANDKIRFELISLKEAEELLCNFENELNFFKIGCKNQYSER
jgi:antagonist of KipI